jgi:organic radical activating enzyme
MTKPVLPFLETMITQVCNLSCQGCTNYSDLKHSGYTTWEDGRKQLESWLDRIDILDFGIIGGEPLINPEWRQWIRGVRCILPNSQIRFTTNGLLLDRAADLLDICQEVGNIVLKITVHVDNDTLEQQIKQIYQSADWTPVVEYGIRRHRTLNNVKFQVNRPIYFLKTYQGDYNNMRPWHSDPVRAFEHCIQQTCPLLYQGKIYKCSTAGLLKDVLSRHKNPNFSEWTPYIDRGLTVDSSIDQIHAFIDNFGLPNTGCAQCPSSADSAVDHKKTVVFKR